MKKHISQFKLLKNRRFATLFGVQSFAAFNDNLYKNALIVLIAYGFLDAGFLTPILTTLSWGVFILPFLLLSSVAGEVASQFNKVLLIRWIKLCEILILVLAAVGLFLKSIVFLYIGLFLMGMHATFFLPARYGLLGTILKPSEFLAGTGLMEGTTFLAVLLGNLLGGFLILEDPSAFLFLIIAFTAAATGLGLSFSFPNLRASSSTKKIYLLRIIYLLKRPIHFTWEIQGQEKLIFAICGISWFWSYEGTLLSQVPALVKTTLHLVPNAVVFFLCFFSIGTASGAFVCNKLLRGVPSARLIPITLLLLSIFLFDFVQAISLWESQLWNKMGIPFYEFFKDPLGIRILSNFVGIAICGGISIVPLYALIQARTSLKNSSQIFALNNVINALFMVCWSLFIVFLFFLNVSISNIFLLIGILNSFLGIGAWFSLKTESGQKFIEWLLVKTVRNLS